MHPPGFSEPRPQVHSVGNKFLKQQKFNGTGQRRSQLHQADHGKKKFGFNRDHTGNGNNKKSSMELDAGNIAKEKKRPYVWKYTPQEIQQWRGARRQNYPTKLDFEKNLKENASDCNLDEEATVRRQQFMEVFEKQASYRSSFTLFIQCR
ncbi:hypothetical protein Bca52824_023322 [Brassica carinata]|uniref:FMR1-interacting protein 1 conserved domain-containing protein n=1 Tax=Brassica carinata TaxID=52824 RepID=A0A8X7VI13_BRACI|nr:hypothetical protein Bca52824_023322 [Brassica carinata]